MAQPVWTRPAWIMAMVTLVSAFFTIPQIVGDYLTKQQDIKLAKEKTVSIKLQNRELQQDQEFKIVSNTLARQGAERIFVLRYLAATLDDKDAKQWAQSEVVILNELVIQKDKATKTEELLRKKQKVLDLLVKEGSVENEQLKDEIEKLRGVLSSTNTELIQKQDKAGVLSGLSENSYILSLKAEIESYSVNVGVRPSPFGDGRVVSLFDIDGKLISTNKCRFDYCSFDFKYEPIPLMIKIKPYYGILNVFIAGRFKNSKKRLIQYDCEKSETTEEMICRIDSSIEYIK